MIASYRIASSFRITSFRFVREPAVNLLESTSSPVVGVRGDRGTTWRRFSATSSTMKLEYGVVPPLPSAPTRQRQPVSHVIFDMDGLLLDTVPIYNDIMRTVVVRQGYEFTDELRARLLGRNRRDCAELIVRHCDRSLSVADCLEQLAEQHARRLANCRLMPGAERLVRHLHRHGYPMAIGTSSSVKSVALKSKGHERLLRLIHHVVCGTDDPRVVRGKPAPDIFLAAADGFDAPPPEPGQCLVFEDALNGVQAARAAGMQVVYVRGTDLDDPSTDTGDEGGGGVRSRSNDGGGDKSGIHNGALVGAQIKTDEDSNNNNSSNNNKNNINNKNDINNNNDDDDDINSVNVRQNAKFVIADEAIIERCDRTQPCSPHTATMVIDSLLNFRPELFGLPPFEKKAA